MMIQAISPSNLRNKMMIQAISPDRISSLPEPIIHRILKLLPTDDFEEANSLSKTWYDFCSSFPYLDFDDYTLYNAYGDSDVEDVIHEEEGYFDPRSERYMNYIGEALSRFHDRNPGILIRRIRIRITLINSRFASLLSDRIRLALEYGVDKIYLETWGFCYSLPMALFASNSIRVLKVKGGSFLDSFRHGDISVSCSELRKLVIKEVCFDELALGSLIANFPLMEKLVIEDAMGLTNLCISRLYKLKSLVVSHSDSSTGNIKMVEVDAPMLHCLELTGFGRPPCNIGMLECPRLVNLTMSDVEVDNFQLEEILSRLPFLRNLRLTKLSLLTKFKLSNDSLKELSVIGCEHLVELEINAPNLLKFMFEGNSVPLMAPIHTIMGESHITLIIGWEPSLFQSFVVNFGNFLSRMNCVKELNIRFVIKSVERVVQTVNAIEFDSNSVPLVGPMHTIMGTSRVTLDIRRKPLLYDKLAVKFRNFLSRMGRVDDLYLYLTHFGMISADEPVTNIEDLTIIVEISESFQDIFNRLLRSYHPRTLIMRIELYKNSGAMTFLRDIMVSGGTCCSWLPYIMEEITIVADNDIIFRLPLDGTVPSIALEGYLWGEIKFVFKW